jgi:heat shock protein HslJ
VSYGNESNENIKEANGYYYLISFHTDGTYSGQISCNTMGGEYSHKGNEIKITHPLKTQLGCEGEDPDKFFQGHLSDVYSYKVIDTELRLYYSKDQYFKFRIK